VKPCSKCDQTDVLVPSVERLLSGVQPSVQIRWVSAGAPVPVRAAIQRISGRHASSARVGG
jgi:hypothetical protein